MLRKEEYYTMVSEVLLTGLLRSYNEEVYMEPCLNCLLKFCDEVVISDGGSTDRTKEIATSFDRVTWLDYLGGSVSEYGHWNHTAEQLNFALPHCRGRWIILQDVDQVYCERVQKHLRRELKVSPHDAYVMYGIHFLGDTDHYIKELAVGPGMARLWRNGPERKFKGVIHSSHLSYLEWNNLGLFRGSRFHYGYISTELEMKKARERSAAVPDNQVYATVLGTPYSRTPVAIPWERCDPDCKTCWMEGK
jgi:glycosyltransferase involved in cell wall biosynthesis